MPRVFAIESALSTLPDDDRADFERLACEPGVTLDELAAWIARRELKVSRSAIHNWRRGLEAIAQNPIARMRLAVRRLVSTAGPGAVAVAFDALATDRRDRLAASKR